MPRETNIQIRRGTANDWASVNPTLAAGEMAIENDTRRVKVGDGTTAWNELRYLGLDGGDLDGGAVFLATATGTDVVVEAFPQSGSEVGVGLSFSNVSEAGTTTVGRTTSGNPDLPGNFSLNNSLGSYSITTTATFTGNVYIKFVLPSTVTQQVFESVRIFKLTSGVTTDVTVLEGVYAPDFATRTVWASVESFSEFFVIPSAVTPTATPATPTATPATPTATPATPTATPATPTATPATPTATPTATPEPGVIQAASLWSGDPYWANVTTLLSFNNNLTDASGTYQAGDFSLGVGASLSSAESRWGGGSLACNSFGDAQDGGVLGPPSMFEFGGDFTVEAWLRPTAVSGDYSSPRIFTSSDKSFHPGTSQPGGAFHLSIRGNGEAPSSSRYFPTIQDNGTNGGLVGSSYSLPFNQWTHVAATRSSGVVKLYVNGVLQGAAAGGGGSAYTNSVIGGHFAGYIDSVRVTKGVARQIVVPSSEFAPTEQGEIYLTTDLNSTKTIYSDSLTLSIVAGAYNSTVTGYQWQRREPSGATWANISLETTNTLSLTALTDADDTGASYRCIVTSPTQTVRSTELTLTVDESGINGDNRFRVTAPANTTALTAAVDSTTGYWSMVSSPASSAPAAIVLSGVQDTVNWSGGTGPNTFTRVADQNGRPRYNVYIWPGGNYYVEWSGSEWRLIRHTGAVLATNSADEPAPPTSGWSGEPNIAITYQMSLVFGSQWSQYSPYYYNTGTIQGMPSGVEKTVEVFSCDANGDPSGELEYVSFAPSSQSITKADASGCTSLRGFRLSSSTGPSSSWSGSSSLPSTIVQVRAVGVAGSGGSYSQWGNYPANVSEGINVEGQQLDAGALNQLYTDLGTGTNSARIFVGGNPGTTGDDPTIATAKSYTVFGS